MNRHFVSLMCVSLLASGSALAAPQTAGAKSAPPPAADHANMQMGGMPMEHGAMQMKPTAADKAEFDKLDSNHDGKLSKAELPAKNPLSAHFGMFDADKDGSLTLAEFVSMRGM
jgi:EF hand domain-containing protein